MGNVVSSVKILDAATATGRGEKHFVGDRGRRSFQARGTTSAGAGAASIDIQVTNVAVPTESSDAQWLTAMTISLTLGTTETCDGNGIDRPWRWVRAKVASISGTNASVTVEMGG